MYNKLINDIVVNDFLVSIIIDMSLSSNEEIETLKMVIKDIKKKKKIIINNGNNKQYYIKNKYDSWYGISQYNKCSKPKLDKQYTNIFIFKDNTYSMPTKIKYMSGFILRIKNDNIYIDKCRASWDKRSLDIKTLLRRQKIKKLNK